MSSYIGKDPNESGTSVTLSDDYKTNSSELGASTKAVKTVFDELQSKIPDEIPTPSDVLPSDNGVASAGSSSSYARADHVHAQTAYYLPEPDSDLDTSIAVGENSFVITGTVTEGVNAYIEYFLLSIPELNINEQKYQAAGNSATISFNIPEDTPIGTILHVTIVPVDNKGNRGTAINRIITVKRSFVSTPRIVSPIGNSVVTDVFTVVSSSFATVGAVDTHTLSEYRVSDSRGSVIYQSGELGGNITTHKIDLEGQALGEYIKVEVRYKGSSLGWSDWGSTRYKVMDSIPVSGEYVILTDQYVSASDSPETLNVGHVKGVSDNIYYNNNNISNHFIYNGEESRLFFKRVNVTNTTIDNIVHVSVDGKDFVPVKLAESIKSKISTINAVFGVCCVNNTALCFIQAKLTDSSYRYDICVLYNFNEITCEFESLYTLQYVNSQYIDNVIHGVIYTRDKIYFQSSYYKSPNTNYSLFSYTIANKIFSREEPRWISISNQSIVASYYSSATNKILYHTYTNSGDYISYLCEKTSDTSIRISGSVCAAMSDTGKLYYTNADKTNITIYDLNTKQSSVIINVTGTTGIRINGIVYDNSQKKVIVFRNDGVYEINDDGTQTPSISKASSNIYSFISNIYGLSYCGQKDGKTVLYIEGSLFKYDKGVLYNYDDTSTNIIYYKNKDTLDKFAQENGIESVTYHYNNNLKKIVKHNGYIYGIYNSILYKLYQNGELLPVVYENGSTDVVKINNVISTGKKYSYDGSLWYDTNIPSELSRMSNSVVVGDVSFSTMSIGSSSVYISKDGKTFYPSNVNIKIDTVVFDGTKFYASEGTNTYYSSDGGLWVSLTTSFNIMPYTVYYDGVYIAPYDSSIKESVNVTGTYSDVVRYIYLSQGGFWKAFNIGGTLYCICRNGFFSKREGSGWSEPNTKNSMLVTDIYVGE